MAQAREVTETVAIIVGAGAGGLAVAFHLKKRKIPFIILEKASDLGGTWRDNIYPGAGCDVVSSLYSFSFAPNPYWSRRFARQDEILDYLKSVAARFGIDREIHYRQEVVAATFDVQAGRWQIKTLGGEQFVAQFFISAVGQLNRPDIPHFENQDTFQGWQFHSAQWDHNCDLSGKSVAVIGSGASAIQFLPPIARQAAHVALFQRSPNWITPKDDHAISPRRQALLARFPFLMRLERWKEFWGLELTYKAFIQGSRLGRRWQKSCVENIHRIIANPDIRKAVTPDYPAGCKRVLLSNDWYETVARSNVSVVTQAISAMTPDGIMTSDGTVHSADVVIYATGFKSLDFLAPMRVTGVDGIHLEATWGRYARAYLGMAVPGFPNFFMLYGPNTNLGHGSIFFMLECQAKYIARAIRRARLRGWTSFSPKPTALDRFERRLRMNMSKTVWTGDCSSWYKNADGVIVNNWSGTMLSYRLQLLAFRHRDFDFV